MIGEVDGGEDDDPADTMRGGRGRGHGGGPQEEKHGEGAVGEKDAVPPEFGPYHRTDGVSFEWDLENE